MLFRDLQPGDMYLLKESCWIVISVVPDVDVTLDKTNWLNVVYLKMWEVDGDGSGWYVNRSFFFGSGWADGDLSGCEVYRRGDCVFSDLPLLR